MPGALRVTHADGRPYGLPPPPIAATTPHVGRAEPPRRGPTTAAPHIERTEPQPPPRDTATVDDARRALVGLGFTRPEAARAVDVAATHVGRDAPLETLIRAALRECPRPRSPS